MLVMLVDPGGFPLRTWVMLSGHLVLPEGWHGAYEIYSTGALQKILRGK